MRRTIQRYPNMITDYLKALFFGSPEKFTVKKFEQALAQRAQVKEAVCTSFGCHALSLALDYYGFNSTKKILLPSYTAEVVERLLIEKNIPYDVIDVDPTTANISNETFKSIDLKKYNGIILTHLFGITAPMEIIQTCLAQNLIVIEDCAHSQGARFANGAPVGSLGHAGFYSFGYAKIINTYTGGALFSNNDELIAFARQQMQFCAKPPLFTMLRRLLFGNMERVFYYLSPIFYFYNSRADLTLQSYLKKIANKLTRKKVIKFYQYTDAQALLGLKQLLQLENTLSNRSTIAQQYIETLPTENFLQRKAGDVFYNLVYRTPSAVNFRKKLMQQNIDSVTGESTMQKIGSGGAGVTKCLNEYTQLPFFAGMTSEQINNVVKAVKKINSEN